MLSVSDTFIANAALEQIGAKSGIQNLNENSVEAKACKFWYEFCRVHVLEAYNWGFARKRLALAASSDDPPEGVWSYRYQYPVDCLRAREIENPLGPTADAIPFTIEETSDGSAKSILTNAEEAKLVYTRDVQQTSLFPAHFIDTLAAQLASRIALKLTGKRTIRDDMQKLYAGLLTVAPAHDANEAVEDKPREAEWIRARA